MSIYSASPLLPAALSEAKQILQSLSVNWPEQQAAISNSQPLWQASLATLDPEWAQVFGASINWLDQAPLVLSEASQEIVPDGEVKSYEQIARKLDALLQEVSSKKKGLSVLVSSPSERLEVLLKEKQSMDNASKQRQALMQQALDMGDDTRLLASLLSDAIPHLRQRIDNQRMDVNAEVVDTMFKEQKAARTLKILGRADSALSLVKTRIENELSSSSSLTRTSLEKMVSQEEALLGRLDVLSSSAARAIAGEQVKAKTDQQGARLSVIALPDGQENVQLPVPVSEMAVQEKRPGFWAKLLRNPLPMGRGGFGFSAPASPTPKLSASAASVLRKMESDYAKYPILMWFEIERVQEDPTVSASSKLPVSGVKILDRMIGKDLWESDRPGKAFEMLEFFLASEKGLSADTCNWARLAEVCAEKIEQSHGNPGPNSLICMRLLAQAAPFVDLSTYEDMLVKNCMMYLNSGIDEDDNSALKCILHYVSLKSIKESIFQTYMPGSSVAKLMKLIKQIESPDVASAVALSSILYVREISGEPQELEMMEMLSPEDHQILAKKILSKSSTDWKKLGNIIQTSTVQSDIGGLPSLETQWSFALRDMEKWRRGVMEKVSTPIVACAFSMKNINLLERAISGALDKNLDHQLLDQSFKDHSLISTLIEMEVSRPDTETKKLSADEWCSVFEPYLNATGLVEYKDAPGNSKISRKSIREGRETNWSQGASREIQMTPLMQAAYHGNKDWIEALLSKGTNPEERVGGRSAISMLKNFVLKDVMRHEDHRVKIDRADKRVQDVYIRKMTHQMNQTGLWDIYNASPQGRLGHMVMGALITGLSDDDEARKIAREDAIIKCIQKTGAHIYLECIALSVAPQGNFQIMSPEVAGFLKFAVRAGVMEEGDTKEALEVIKRAATPSSEPVRPRRIRQI